ncbi:MAG: hypothetical protein HYS27_13935 [Deltaproteobacteria bacterium]|nr:hypothetical protein [Deltaproteobacteria bacterium]
MQARVARARVRTKEFHVIRYLLLAPLFCCAISFGCASNKAAEHPTGGGATAVKHCGCGDACTCKFEETNGAEPCTCPPPAPPADAPATPPATN